MSKLVIIAADQIEIAPLVRGWRHTRVTAQRHDVDLFENGAVVIGLAGMGPVPARIAADTAHKHCGKDARAFLSVGFAGALNPGMKVGDIFEPKKIICAADDTEIINSGGSGMLVSAGAVAGNDAKKMMARQYGADAVDMEAYSVADVARIYGVPFRAIKVISDELAFPMPPMGRFINEQGRFQRGSFIIYSLLRPWSWPTVARLARNGQRAADSLCQRLLQEVGNAVDAAMKVRQMSEVPR
jgi:nucleoside phosphorylase